MASPVSKDVTIPFIANLSLKEGIIEYVGNYHKDVIALAKKLDVWDKPFDRGVTPSELMAEGFSGNSSKLVFEKLLLDFDKSGTSFI